MSDFTSFFEFSEQGPTGPIVTTVPANRVATVADARVLANALSLLYGATVTVESALPPGAVVSKPAPNGATLLNVVVPNIGPFNAGELVSMEQGDGFWSKDVIGQPEWKLKPVVVIVAPATQNPPNEFPGFPNSHPTSNPSTTDIWNALVVIKQDLDKLLAK